MGIRHEIAVDALQLPVFSFINDRLLLGTGRYQSDAGDARPLPYNNMTISWGMLGTVWGKPMVQVLVRPQRYSFELLKETDSLTLALLPPEYKAAHTIFGAKSGLADDKYALSGLHAEASHRVAAPSIVEASLVMECRIAYRDRLKPAGFIAPYIKNHYADDWHFLYYAEVLGVYQQAEDS